MKRCELCKSAAAIFCDSDQASLCWDCDAKVHSANFLVARHSRCLLCHVCQSPTAWSASGERLGRTVSVCGRCVDGCEFVEEENGGGEEEEREIDVEDDEYGDYDDQDDEGEEDRDEEEEEEVSGVEDEDGVNQVVPWSSIPLPPPPSMSLSSGEEDVAVSVKRLRENSTDLHSDDDLGCSSSHRKNSSPAAAFTFTARDGDAAAPSKRQKTEPNQSSTVHHGPAGSRIAAIVESIKIFHQQELTSGGGDAASAIAGICKLSQNPAAVEFGPAESS